MAVPQIRRVWAFGDARAVRLSLVLDLVVGLLIMLVLPLAVVTIPNTVSVVAELLPADVSRVAMTRAHGMALPALLLTVPLAVLAARRFRAAPLLLAGLVLLAGAEAAGGYADSALVAGVLRAVQGVGGGLLLCATLLAVWERHGAARRVLLSLWAGALVASMLTAQALALWPLDKATSWRVTLQPYPLVTGLALAVGAGYLVLWLVSGDARVTRPAVVAGGRLLPAAAPAVGIAALALGTTFDWPSVLTLAAAGVSVVVLFALALLGAPDGTPGRSLAITMTVVGLVVLPTAAQTTYMELGGVGGPGLIGLWPPFAIAVVAALVVPVLIGHLSRRAAPAAVARHAEGAGSGAGPRGGLRPAALAEHAAARDRLVAGERVEYGAAEETDGRRAGHAADASSSPTMRYLRGGLTALVAGLAAIRLIVPSAEGMTLTVPFVLIAVGAAVALAAALCATSSGAALFALTLCFPGVLAGFLLGTGMQIARVRAVERMPNPSAQALVDGFVATLHTWALVAGFTVVAGLVLTAILVRRRAGDRPEEAAGETGGGRAAVPGDPASPGHPAGPAAPTIAMDILVAGRDRPQGGRPVVPPPSPSPEASPGPVGGMSRPEPPPRGRGRQADGRDASDAGERPTEADDGHGPFGGDHPGAR